MNNDLQESIELFLSEAGDYLEILNSELLKLEKSTNRNKETSSINNMFRAAHSIKGMSAMLGFSKINTLTHKMENLLDEIRKNNINFTDKVIEILFKCFDALTSLIAAISNNEPEHETYNIEKIIESINQIIEKNEEIMYESNNPTLSNNSTNILSQLTLSLSKEVLESLKDFDDLNLFIAERSNDNIFEIIVYLESDCFKNNISPLNLIKILKENGDIILSIPKFDETIDILNLNLDNIDVKIIFIYQTKLSIDDLKTIIGEFNIRDLRKPLPTLNNEVQIKQNIEINPKIEKSNYIDLFIQEANEEIEKLNEALLLLEKKNDDIENINVVFRVMHSIKSSSAAMGFNNISKIAHNVENLLVKIKNNNKVLSSDLITLLFNISDKIKMVLVNAKNNGELIEFDDEIKKLDKFIVDDKNDEDIKNKSNNINLEIKLNEYENSIVHEAVEHGKKIFKIYVEIEENTPLKSMRYLLILNNFKEVGEILKVIPETEDEFEKSSNNSFVFIFITSETDVLRLQKIGDIDQIKRIDVTTWHLDENIVNKPIIKHETNVDDNLHLNVKADLKTDTKLDKTNESLSNITSQTLRVDINKLDNLINLIGELVIIKANFMQVSNQLSKTFQNKKMLFQLEDLIYDIERQKDEIYKNNLSILKNITNLKELLVQLNFHKSNDNESLKFVNNFDIGTIIHFASNNFDKINQFINNLVLSLKNILKDIKMLFKNENYVIDFNSASYKLGKIINSLQTGIMDTRMVPIGQLFRRFQRVVRDLSKAQNKLVELEIYGEDTELDKKVIDELGNPLTHIIRNSIDHGLESPIERKQNNKNEVGKIILNAYHEGSNICITISDDGRGIKVDKVLKKAIEKGLVSEAETSSLTKNDIINFIFMPGFSTAEVVTDISGRGVGMDIVKKTIENLKGSIIVDTKENVGTKFIIKLPLTLAILTALLVKISDAIFAIPLESVIEITKVYRKDINTVEGKLTINLRNKILAVVQLADIIGIEQYANIDEMLTVVIVSSNNETIGICVDNLIGKEEIVIKSLSDDFKKVKGISGASVLGDGKITLILDVPAIIKLIK